MAGGADGFAAGHVKGQVKGQDYVPPHPDGGYEHVPLLPTRDGFVSDGGYGEVPPHLPHDVFENTHGLNNGFDTYNNY